MVKKKFRKTLIKTFLLVSLVFIFLFLSACTKSNPTARVVQNINPDKSAQNTQTQGALLNNTPVVKAESCADSDNKNIEVQGIVSHNLDGSIDYSTDHCLNNYYVVEFYCNNNKAVSDVIDCRTLGRNYVCQEGKCVVFTLNRHITYNSNVNNSESSETHNQTNTQTTRKKRRTTPPAENSSETNETKTPVYICEETDNGMDYYAFGKLSFSSETESHIFADTCNDDYLTEYYCAEDNTSKNITKLCLYGCDNGQCLLEDSSKKEYKEVLIYDDSSLNENNLVVESQALINNQSENSTSSDLNYSGNMTENMSDELVNMSVNLTEENVSSNKTVDKNLVLVKFDDLELSNTMLPKRVELRNITSDSELSNESKPKESNNKELHDIKPVHLKFADSKNDSDSSNLNDPALGLSDITHITPVKLPSKNISDRPDSELHDIKPAPTPLIIPKFLNFDSGTEACSNIGAKCVGLKVKVNPEILEAFSYIDLFIKFDFISEVWKDDVVLSKEYCDVDIKVDTDKFSYVILKMFKREMLSGFKLSALCDISKKNSVELVPKFVAN